MLYHIQYYIDNTDYYSVNAQMSESIKVELWQQPNNLKINDLISRFHEKKDSLYVPYYIFFKYENNDELVELDKMFGNRKTDINQFNIDENTLTDNLYVINISQYNQ